MKLSFDWLCDFVDLKGISPQELADKLTMGAFEVEEVTISGPDLVGPIVVGEILEIHPHPNADKIRLTKTRIKDGEAPLEIVCGAQNIEVGQRVPVALPGAKVVNRKDGTALLIKASAIRGVQSNGMLCSPPELGLDLGEGAGEGILILNGNGKTPPLGQDIQELLQIKTDYILHVEPRSNRGDALSVQGLAREVAALFNRPLKTLPWSVDELTTPATSAHPPAIWLDNAAGKEEATLDCPFFSLQEIGNIKIGPAPTFIARRLEAIGLRSVNNVVDITNYVMHELGQPLHAYDKAKLKHEAMGVRRARAGEKLVTLDGKERALTDEMLVIVDGPGPQAQSPEGQIIGVAGIMGGKESEVTDSTRTLLLEAACFSQAVVRRGSRLLGLSSDASLRFERGVDVASVHAASNRAAYLIGKYCTDSQAQAAHYGGSGADKVDQVVVELRIGQIKRILGLHIEDSLVKSLLTPLGFEVKGQGEKLAISVPSFRQSDVKREIDLIEEVCRLNGYDKIAAVMPSATVALVVPDDSLALVRQSLCAQGLSEAWLSSLVPESTPGISTDRLVSVLNPLSTDHQTLRQSLVPGLLQATAYNQDRGAKSIWLFESGRIYLKEQSAALPESNQQKFNQSASGTGVQESLRVAGILCGEKFKAISTLHVGRERSVRSALTKGLQDPADRGCPETNLNYYSAKGLVENIFAALGIDADRYQFLPVGDNHSSALPWLHPYRSAVVALNRPSRKGSGSGQEDQSPWENALTLGYVGQVHAKMRDQLGLRQDAFVFELDMAKIGAERKPKKFSEIATSPAIVRDLTADFEKARKSVSHQEVTKLIGKKAGTYIRQIELVSIFESDKEADKLSLSYRLTFQHPSETLTSEEIDKVMAGVRESLSQDLGASFRL
jgi:phenylalanyl-tRNA synthetase beta chain